MTITLRSGCSLTRRSSIGVFDHVQRSLIDDLIDLFGLKVPDLMKIYVDGCELQVLK
jgi:hypothetical protein